MINMPGAGTNLHNIIKEWTGAEPVYACGCRAWIAKMDRDLGWAVSNKKLIVTKLLRSAQKRQGVWKYAAMLPGARLFLEGVVQRAIETAEPQVAKGIVRGRSR
jgi:hypothetical protein